MRYNASIRNKSINSNYQAIIYDIFKIFKLFIDYDRR